MNARGALNAETFAPRATLVSPISNVNSQSVTSVQIEVNYRDNQELFLPSLDDSDLTVTRVGYSGTVLVKLQNVTNISSAEARATYTVQPGGRFGGFLNGTYEVSVGARQIRDKSGAYTRSVVLGKFQVNIGAANVYYVNTMVDSVDANIGDGLAQDALGRTSLRAAVQEANSTTSFTTIFLPDGRFSLQRTLQSEDFAAQGDLDILGKISIFGTTGSRIRRRAHRILE